MSKVVSLCEYRSKVKQEKYVGQGFDYINVGDIVAESIAEAIIEDLAVSYDSTLMVCEVCLGDDFHIFYDSLDNTTAVCRDCGHRHLIF